jgi:lipoprotein-releasing system permease protein
VYTLILCWRYLLTRFLAVICIVSVLLGVATLIVVNSVMSGFSTKLKDRLHGLLSDVLVEAVSLDGFPDPDEKIERIRRSPVGSAVAAVTPTVEVFAMAQYRWGATNQNMTRPVRLIGIDPAGRAAIGGFAEYLVDPRNKIKPSFDLSSEAQRRQAMLHPVIPPLAPPMPEPLIPGEPPPPDPPPSTEFVPQGIIVGNAIASFREKKHKPGEPPQDVFVLQPGDDMMITTVSAQRMSPVFARFVVCDYFKSEMSEYDANFVFVPLDYLQKLRSMGNRVTSLHLRLSDPMRAKEVADTLQMYFPPSSYNVQTWEQKQGPLLAAISIERGILNVVLFLIVLVAGFGILAIFSMIVFEKTRDIGIIKSLGASTTGVMGIFLSYGLLLGVVGSGLGTVLGLLITNNINDIEKVMSRLSGHEVFDRSIYYFDAIPTDIQPSAVLAINLGAIAIAVIFSILPALRAAWLHPVQALRYE